MTLDVKHLPKEAYVTRAGSYGYGLNTPESDEDFRGFFFPKSKYLLGFVPGQETIQKMEGGLDFTLWEVRKTFHLAAQANPNVLEVLFTEPVDHIYVTPLAKEILKGRDLFLSRKIAKTYLGYAVSNYKRVVKGPGEFDYDGKDAMHMIRLLHTGYHTLTTGKLQVKQNADQRAELLTIKARKVPWEQLDKTFKHYRALIEKAEADSPLPLNPNTDALNDLLVQAMRKWLVDE